MRKESRNKAFTLVELLVVIGIIAVLMGILLPTLGAAREQARSVKCQANLRSIGQGIAIYLAQYNKFPPSNFYVGLQISGGTQTPATPAQGYVHWTSFLYKGGGNPGQYLSTNGWEMFQCPSLEGGGVPPANTYPGNSDGLPNEAGDGVIDEQAPRVSYMLNEALTPRSIFVAGFRGATRPYRFVPPGQVSNSAEVILATEMWGVQNLMKAASNVSGSAPVSNSRRPVSGISKSRTGGIATADKAYTLPLGGTFGWATVDNLDPNPVQTYNSPQIPNPDTTLDFVGRNHGKYTLGSIGRSSRSGWDLRKSNFLYVDGHVENKHVAETVAPNSQWGSKFYDLEQE